MFRKVRINNVLEQIGTTQWIKFVRWIRGFPVIEQTGSTGSGTAESVLDITWHKIELERRRKSSSMRRYCYLVIGI